MQRLFSCTFTAPALAVLLAAGSAQAQNYSNAGYRNESNRGQGMSGGYYNSSPNRGSENGTGNSGYYNNYSGRGSENGSGNGWYYDYYSNGRNRSGEQNQESDENYGQGRNGQSQGQILRGWVVRTKPVEIRGTDSDAMAALVETESGRHVVVDLGPAEDLREEGIRLRQGNGVSVRGRFQQIGDHRVFIAQSVRTRQGWAAIERPYQQSQRLLRREANLSQSFYPSAARRGQGQGEEVQENQEEQPEGQLRPRSMSIQGKLLGTKQIELPGMNNALQIAVVKSDEGRKYVVCLGPAEALEGAALKKGAEFSARGPMVRLGERRFLLAQSARVDGQKLTIQQHNRGENAHSNQQFRGQIQNIKEIEFPGLKQKWVVAQAQGSNGQPRVVWLGPADEIDDLQLQKGDQISVNGQALSIDGKRIVLAEQVRAKGETVQIGE